MLELSSLQDVPLTRVVCALVLLCSCFVIFSCLYNLYLHPLRKIPGPKLAAMWSCYEFYFDVIKDGTYLWEIRRMHAKYGPIIRINPNEIHIDDPQYYSSIYTGGTRKVEKDPSTVAGFAVPSSVAATVDHVHHRSRRGYMNPYFSKRSIVGMESMIHERISTLCRRLEETNEEGSMISLDKAFSAMTADIITNRFYGFHYDYLSRKDLKFPVRDAFLGVSLIFHLARFAPALVRSLKKLPISVIRCILPSVADFLALQDEIKENITTTLEKQSLTEAASKSVIIEALGDERIPPEERTLKRLLDEGTVIIFAGTETSSRALAVGMFYLLNNKSLITRLRAELAILPDQPDEKLTLQQLEPLPFLTGCVEECIRLSFGPVSRLPRVATEETLQYKDYLIPPGYPVSQSTYFVHTNPTIFPEPYTFNPDRWIQAAERGFPLNSFLVSFTKGSRQCLGIGMAHAELYLTIARVVRNFDMDLCNTTVEDVQIHNVRIVGYPKFVKGKGPGQGEVEVVVTGKAVRK